MEDNNYKRTFPEDIKEYKYYFDIKNIENALEKFNNIIDIILTYDDNTDEEQKKVIHKEIIELKNDFLLYANKMINKESIDSFEDYNNLLDILIIILSNASEIIDREFYLKRRIKFYRKKVYYNGKKISIKKLIKIFFNIIYDLNPFMPSNVLTNKYGVSIFLMSIVVFMLTSISNILKLDIVTSIIFIVGFLTLSIIGICFNKTFASISNCNKIYREKYKHSYHPSFIKINLIEILSVFKYLIKQ